LTDAHGGAAFDLGYPRFEFFVIALSGVCGERSSTITDMGNFIDPRAFSDGGAHRLVPSERELSVSHRDWPPVRRGN
jgi:hypothetical protein